MPEQRRKKTIEIGRFIRILDSLEKPLEFASRDGFTRLKTLKGLEDLVAAFRKEASGLVVPDRAARGFKELARALSGFDGLGVEEKKESIVKAVGLIGSIRALLQPLPATFETAPADPTRPPELTPAEVAARLETLSTSLKWVKGIGPKLSERLAKKGFTTVEDMLYFLPFRYEDRRNLKKIAELEPGTREVVTGELIAMGEVRYGRRKVFEMAVSDGSGLLKLKWFNYRLQYMEKRYTVGQRLSLFGNVTRYASRHEIIHPDVEILDEAEGRENLKGIVPIYSQIENFHPKTARKLVAGIVEKYAPVALGGVPGDVLKRHGLMDLGAAFKEVHAPGDPGGPEGEGGSDVNPANHGWPLARRSITFDELFTLELGLALKRKGTRRQCGMAFKSKGELARRLTGLLPFELTKAQKRSVQEITGDMVKPHPMNRLIQGDVGSGKTIVSFLAVLTAVECGRQAAIMAPTEILAEQHYLTTHEYVDALGIKSVLLTSSTPKAERKKILKAITAGEVDLIIGTHALIQKDVIFNSLGLAVVDEQHRFGVVQRGALKKKGGEGGVGDTGDALQPDVLVMTATPIPRTLSMTVFGDMDVSIIDELPPGRIPVRTKLLREKDREKAYELIRSELARGGQAYVVYPLVEESEELSLKDATTMKEHLEQDVFSEYRVGLLHGRMKGAEKEAVMKAFKAHELDVLVTTTVIEVGVDVPGATVMFVEHAERFGLAQLHQLRGRVGRGLRGGLCLLLAAFTRSEDTWKRLKVMERTTDGFRIAEEDLKIRGPGDFIGTRQSGLPDFRTADALSDLNLLKTARDEAFKFLEREPELTSLEAHRVKEVLKARWKSRLELAEVG